MTIGMSHHLISFFGGSIEADWMVDTMLLAEWQLGITAIH
jgi:hypothetical protein